MFSECAFSVFEVNIETNTLRFIKTQKIYRPVKRQNLTQNPIQKGCGCNMIHLKLHLRFGMKINDICNCQITLYVDTFAEKYRFFL